MSEPANREQIRDEAIQRIALAVEQRRRASGGATVTVSGTDLTLGEVVDALGDLLPTAIEGRYIGRGLARRTRYVTGWREPEAPE